MPWIWTAVSMNLVAIVPLAFNPGNNNPLVLFPASILLFIGIWIEKGIGLIVPGLVPSPLGEIVDYAPSWVEVCITLGVLSLGIFIVALLSSRPWSSSSDTTRDDGDHTASGLRGSPMIARPVIFLCSTHLPQGRCV